MKARKTIREMYSAEKNAANRATSHATVRPLALAAASTWSLAKKPDKGGMPAMASQPTTNPPKVTGISLRRPPIRLRSVSLSSPCMIEPADRNSSAL